MLRNYKYRLYPTPAQEELLWFLCRMEAVIWNQYLELKEAARRYGDRQADRPEVGQWNQYVNQNALQPFMYEWRRNHGETVGQLPSTTMLYVMARQDKAQKAALKRRKQGLPRNRWGFPRFKRTREHQSIIYRHTNGCRLFVGEHHRFAYLRLANVPERIRVRAHRAIPGDGKIKTCVVKHRAGRWYAVFSVELPDVASLPGPLPMIGIDLGLTIPIVYSDGGQDWYLDCPRFLIDAEARTVELQRALSRRMRVHVHGKGKARRVMSKRAQATRLELSRHLDRVQRQREAWAHEVSTELARSHAYICVEDLKTGFMFANPEGGRKTKLQAAITRSARDRALGRVLQLLEYKCGPRLIRVPARGTSQCCSGCGAVVAKDVTVRVHRCPECGLELDRDVNAARNVLLRGRAILEEQRAQPERSVGV